MYRNKVFVTCGTRPKGVDEVSSCVYKHLKNEVNGTEVEQVTLIADNCGSQNKSRMTNQMLVHAFRELPNVRVINYFFLEKGHTQNANDSIHSSIEQAKRGVTINHPCQ